jgi:hypothetical protein
MRLAKILNMSLSLAAAALVCAGAGTASATALTNEGSIYTGTLDAASVDIALEGSFGTVECGKSNIKTSIESHGSSVTAEGKVGELTLSECNVPVTVLKAGSIQVHTLSTMSGGDGTVTSSGVEISVHTKLGICVFTTSGTDLGVLDDGALTFSELDVDAVLARTSGSFLCGASGRLTGNYIMGPAVSVH